MFYPKWLRQAGALLLGGMLAFSPLPPAHAAGDDWQTIYKGVLRSTLNDETVFPADGQGALAVLVDLNLDGVPELFLGRPTEGSRSLRQYTISGNAGAELQPATAQDQVDLAIQDLKLYYNSTTGQTLLSAESHGVEEGAQNSFAIYEYALADGQFTGRTIFSYTDQISQYGGVPRVETTYRCIVNGSLTTVTKATYENALAQYYDGYELVEEYEATSALLEGSRREAYNAEEVDALLKSYTPCPVLALPSQSPVIVDGRQMDLAVYNIGGNTYFKLRDLAEALNGTGKQYNVGWDNESRQVAIESGQPYQPVAGDPTAPQSTVPSLGKQPSDAYVSFDGRKVEAEKYNINGNNYFKLRDLAQLLDFQVEWQQSSRSILIDTTKTYSPA